MRISLRVRRECAICNACTIIIIAPRILRPRRSYAFHLVTPQFLHSSPQSRCATKIKEYAHVSKNVRARVSNLNTDMHTRTRLDLRPKIRQNATVSQRGVVKMREREREIRSRGITWRYVSYISRASYVSPSRKTRCSAVGGASGRDFPAEESPICRFRGERTFPFRVQISSRDPERAISPAVEDAREIVNF